jgi:NAD(P)-dependent dehydrogenase (short-subunit alcohol dehydrogenase family)
MFDSGVRAHYVATALSAGLLRTTPGSLVVTVSMHVGAAHEARYAVAYSVAKAASDRLALATAVALEPDGGPRWRCIPDWCARRA